MAHLYFSKIFLLHWFDIYARRKFSNGIRNSLVPLSKLSPPNNISKVQFKIHYPPPYERGTVASDDRDPPQINNNVKQLMKCIQDI